MLSLKRKKRSFSPLLESRQRRFNNKHKRMDALKHSTSTSPDHSNRLLQDTPALISPNASISNGICTAFVEKSPVPQHLNNIKELKNELFVVLPQCLGMKPKSYDPLIKAKSVTLNIGGHECTLYKYNCTMPKELEGSITYDKTDHTERIGVEPETRKIPTELLDMEGGKIRSNLKDTVSCSKQNIDIANIEHFSHVQMINRTTYANTKETKRISGKQSDFVSCTSTEDSVRCKDKKCNISNAKQTLKDNKDSVKTCLTGIGITKSGEQKETYKIESCPVKLKVKHLNKKNVTNVTDLSRREENVHIKNFKHTELVNVISKGRPTAKYEDGKKHVKQSNKINENLHEVISNSSEFENCVKGSAEFSDNTNTSFEHQNTSTYLNNIKTVTFGGVPTSINMTNTHVDHGEDEDSLQSVYKTTVKERVVGVYSRPAIENADHDDCSNFSVASCIPKETIEIRKQSKRDCLTKFSDVLYNNPCGEQVQMMEMTELQPPYSTTTNSLVINKQFKNANETIANNKALSFKRPFVKEKKARAGSSQSLLTDMKSAQNVNCSIIPYTKKKTPILNRKSFTVTQSNSDNIEKNTTVSTFLDCSSSCDPKSTAQVSTLVPKSSQIKENTRETNLLQFGHMIGDEIDHHDTEDEDAISLHPDNSMFSDFEMSLDVGTRNRFAGSIGASRKTPVKSRTLAKSSKSQKNVTLFSHKLLPQNNSKSVLENLPQSCPNQLPTNIEEEPTVHVNNNHTEEQKREPKVVTPAVWKNINFTCEDYLKHGCCQASSGRCCYTHELPRPNLKDEDIKLCLRFVKHYKYKYAETLILEQISSFLYQTKNVDMSNWWELFKVELTPNVDYVDWFLNFTLPKCYVGQINHSFLDYLLEFMCSSNGIDPRWQEVLAIPDYEIPLIVLQELIKECAHLQRPSILIHRLFKEVFPRVAPIKLCKINPDTKKDFARVLENLNFTSYLYTWLLLIKDTERENNVNPKQNSCLIPDLPEGRHFENKIFIGSECRSCGSSGSDVTKYEVDLIEERKHATLLTNSQSTTTGTPHVHVCPSDVNKELLPTAQTCISFPSDAQKLPTINVNAVGNITATELPISSSVSSHTCQPSINLLGTYGVVEQRAGAQSEYLFHNDRQLFSVAILKDTLLLGDLVGILYKWRGSPKMSCLVEDFVKHWTLEKNINRCYVVFEQLICHVERIMHSAVEPEHLTELLSHIGVYLIINIIEDNEDHDLWSIAHQILTIMIDKKISPLAEQTIKDLTPCRQILMCTEIFLNFDKLSQAAQLLENFGLFSPDPHCWDALSNKEDVDIRINLCEALLGQVIESSELQLALRLFTGFLKAQSNVTLFPGINLSKLYNGLFWLLIKSYHLLNAIEIYKSITCDLLDPHTIRGLIKVLVSQGTLHEAKLLYLHGVKENVYLDVQVTRPLSVTIKTFWTEDDIFLTLQTFFDLLVETTSSSVLVFTYYTDFNVSVNIQVEEFMISSEFQTAKEFLKIDGSPRQAKERIVRALTIISPKLILHTIDRSNNSYGIRGSAVFEYIKDCKQNPK